MLTAHILNVGHGSSVVIDYETGGQHFYGLIDSNCKVGQAPRALSKLRELNAKHLSFICLTHPHKDHLSGLFSVILAYPDAIDYFYSCPMGELLQNRDRLRKLIAKLDTVVKSSDGLEQRQASAEFAQILIWADRQHARGLQWIECKGDEVGIAPTGFSGIDLKTLVPPARVVGEYIQRILRDDATVLGHLDDNEISLALELNFAGRTIIFGGDSTERNWNARRRFEQNASRSLQADVVNLPHHGSARNGCSPAVLSQLYASAGQRRVAVTSANGQSHPDLEVIEWLSKNSIDPYCTNLMPACGANAQRLLGLPTLDPEVARWIREVSSNTGQVQPCQGDVRITIAPSGDVDVVPELNNACAFRGGRDLLFGLLD